MKIVALVLSVVGIIFFVMILSTGDKAIEAGEGAGTVNGALYTAYIIFGLVLAFVLLFVLKGVFAGDLKKTLITIGAFLVIAILGYVMSSSSLEGIPADLIKTENVTESTSKWVGAGLNTFYILAVLAIGAMIFSTFKKVSNR
ncbi:MAG: hypothetical protein R2793_05170 [Flavobacteriaceae bacterium]